jgi:hypothetical protein
MAGLVPAIHGLFAWFTAARDAHSIHDVILRLDRRIGRYSARRAEQGSGLASSGQAG